MSGATIAGLGLLGASLAGCAGEPSASNTPDANLAETGEKDWLGTAPDLSPDNCSETIECDVVVVGSALAGVMSAYGALSNGAKTIMIERNNANHIGGSEMSFINSKYQLENGIPKLDPIHQINMLVQQFQYRNNISMLTEWALHSGEMYDELKEKVFDPCGLNQEIDYAGADQLFPDPTVELDTYQQTGINFQDESLPDRLTGYLDAFHKWLPENGCEIHYRTRGEKLVQDESGAVTGIIATNEAGENVYYKTSKGVIMCTGSYGANEAMLDEFLPARMAEFAKATNSYTCYMKEAPIETLDDGLGHKMMCWAGAKMNDQDHACLGWTNSGYMSFPYLAVNSRGMRFMNEAMSGLVSASWIAQNSPDGNYDYWQIIPKGSAFEMPSTFMLPESVMVEKNKGVEQYECDSIREVAEAINVDPDVLEATVNRYNELCEKGIDEDFAKGERYLDPVKDGPFLAIRNQNFFFCTLDGVQCDVEMRVMKEDQSVIPGLYAAGNTVGYRMGSGYMTAQKGFTNSLAFTHGYVAGRSAANRTA